MRRWLWDTAVELLAAWAPPGTGRTSVDSNGWNRTERGSTPNLPQFQRAYDQLLWEIVTSTREELAPFAATLHSEPNINLPPSLQVAIWRLLGLEAGDDLSQMRDAVAYIAMYCSPSEEAGATETIRKRIRLTEQMQDTSKNATLLKQEADDE